VCSDISLCAWHSSSVSGRQPAADIRCRRSSSSSFCRQPDAAGAVNSSGNSRRPRVSCGCSAGMEQSANTDQDRLLSDNISAANQGLSFPSVIRLTEVYHCPSCRWRAELERVFVFNLLICVRCPATSCDWRHLNLDICSSSSSSSNYKAIL